MGLGFRWEERLRGTSARLIGLVKRPWLNHRSGYVVDVQESRPGALDDSRWERASDCLWGLGCL